MSDSCPTCGAAYGKRRRCYFCTSKHRRLGEERKCPVCGKTFYAPRWAIKDVARNSGTYDSRACKAKVTAIQPKPWAKPEQLTRHTAGYLLEWAPDHPRSRNGRVLQHILIAERMLGRRLEPSEHVHHKNLQRDDNRPENLLVLNKREHHQLHAAMMREKRKAMT